MAEAKDNVIQMPVPAPDSVASSMEDIMNSTCVEYKQVAGFKPGQLVWIGSLNAGDLIEWSEANEGEAKRTAGLRLITKSLCTPPKDPNNPNDPEDKRVRYAADDKNIAVFRRMSHKYTEGVVKEILKLNGMQVKGDKEVKND